jgi:hypothetical protein
VVQSRAAAFRKVFSKMPDVMEYLTRVLSSKVCDITIESSLCPSLSFNCLPSVRGYASKVNSCSYVQLVPFLFANVCLFSVLWMPRVMLATTTLDNSMSQLKPGALVGCTATWPHTSFDLNPWVVFVFATTFATPISSGNGTTLKAKESLV